MLARLAALCMAGLPLVCSRPLSPRQNSCPSVSSQDAPYDQPCSALEGELTCPNGIKGSAGGVILLVPGTARLILVSKLHLTLSQGSTGPETFQDGPYVQILPGLDPGYDVCYISTPDRSLGDAQVTAETVAYNIQQLAPQSKTGKVSLIAHSQGNINIQWALAYWPSARALVTSFISLAGDFHGTAEGFLACTALNLTQGGCDPGVLQQSVGSNYLNAQNSIADNALVPTTSLYTLYDDIIQPEVGGAPTSALPGASTIYVQEPSVCGPTHLVDHFLMTVDSAAFFLAYDALLHGTASTSRFNTSNCVFDYDGSLLQQFATVPGVVRQGLFDAIAVVADNPRTTIEPALKSYVCDGKFERPSACNAAASGVSSAVSVASSESPAGVQPQVATATPLALTTSGATVNPAIGQLLTPGPVATAISEFTQAVTNGEGPPSTVLSTPDETTDTRRTVVTTVIQ